jgi:hypothetical protein
MSQGNVARRHEAQQSGARILDDERSYEQRAERDRRSSAGASTEWRTTMTDRINSSTRRARWALLPAIALVLFAGLPTAMAADQQATDDAVDNAMNWQAARSGGDTGAYAQAYHQGNTVYVPGHRSYR